MHSLIRKECVVLIFLCFAVAQYTAAAASAYDGQDIQSGHETGKNEAEEQQTRSFRKEYTIWFDINKWQIDTAFRGNAETIRRMRREVDSLLVNGIITTDSISVISAASPDGREVYNKWLSRKRGLSAYALLESQYPEIDPAIIIVDPIGEDWETLRRIIYEDSQMPMREELLELAGADLPNDEKEKRLRQMKTAFRYILKHHVYLMRASSVTFNISMPAISLDSVKGPDIPLPEIGRGEIRKAGYAPAPQRQMTRKMILAARTNLLVPALNAGIEVPVGNNWSVAADYYFPWIWPPKENRWCVEMLGLNVEGRYWFGRDRKQEDRLSGHSVGVYAGGGYYDFEMNWKGRQGEYVTAGVDYLYALPVGKKKNIRLEFCIGFGYMHSWVRPYEVKEEFGALIRDPQELRVNWFGPAKLSVGLVVPIYVKTKAGGGR